MDTENTDEHRDQADSMFGCRGPELEDEGALWMRGIAREWATELADAREDLYTLEDGEPVSQVRCAVSSLRSTPFDV